MSSIKSRFRSRPPALRLVHEGDQDAADPSKKRTEGSELDRMFRRYDRLVAVRDELLWGVDVLLAAPSDSTLINLFASIMPKMASLGVCPSLKSAESFGLYCDGSSTLLALDVDQFETPRQTIDWLLSMRDRNPQLTVLLMSSDFAPNAAELDPRSVADGALRVPADPFDLERALERALQRARKRLSSYGGR